MTGLYETFAFVPVHSCLPTIYLTIKPFSLASIGFVSFELSISFELSVSFELRNFACHPWMNLHVVHAPW